LNIAYAYANRSAVYKELKLHQQCLNNIQLAREHKYPAEKMNILDDREKRCLELIVEDDPFDFFKLTYDANPKIPFIIKGVEMKEDEKYGRGIYAKHPLKVGDIICIETPFFACFDPGSTVENCNFCCFCLKDNLMDLIPCHDCNTTMYCNDADCAKSDSRRHQRECKVSTALQTKLLACDIVQRSYGKALTIANESTEYLEQLCNESQQLPHSTIFDFDFSGDPNEPKYQKSQLKAALCLYSDMTKKIPAFEPNEKFNHKVMQHLFKVILHTCCSMKINEITSKDTIAVCLFGALINHSCSPNVTRIEVEDKICFMVMRPIAPNDQLFDCYTQPFFIFPKNIRQERLLCKYGFVCDCEACLDPQRFFR
jgi:SET and MYND domain-containing protein 4